MTLRSKSRLWDCKETTYRNRQHACDCVNKVEQLTVDIWIDDAYLCHSIGERR